MLKKRNRSCILLALAALLATASAEGAAYLGPVAVIGSHDGRRLFVANADAGQIAVVDAASGKVTQSIALPATPTGMVSSPDGTRIYVTCAAPQGTVCVIESDSGRVVDTIRVGHSAIGPAIAPDGSRLYVCNRFDNDVSVIDLGSRRQIARVPVSREPIAAAVTPDGKSIFAANHLPVDRADSNDVAAVVTVIDAVSRETTAIRLPNGSTSVRGLCVSPDGKYAYVSHILARYQLPATQADRGWMNTCALSIIDAAAKKLVATVLLDDVNRGAANPWGVTAAADGKTILVSHSGTHELSVIDADKLFAKLAKPAASPVMDVPNDLSFLVGLRRRIPLAGNGPRGLAAVGSKVYLAEYFSDTLAVVDLSPNVAEPVGQIALGPRPQLTPERRGEMVFHDARISFQQWQSCASCHPDARADALNWDLLNDGLGNPKNTRSLLLVHQGGPAMSLGVRASAEEAVRAGFLRSLFAVRPEADAAAIDAYLKSLPPVPSPHLVDGQLSPAAQRGKRVFFDPQVGCAHCHPEPNYSDKRTHDVGSRSKYDGPADRFTTPRLIEAWRTAPYMHDGQYPTLQELFEQGRHGLPPRGAGRLSDADIADLVEFVLSL